MLGKPQQSSYRQFLGFLFLGSLILCLCLDILPSSEWQLKLETAANAQSPQTSQLVQQGIDHYHSGDFPAAIELWQKALSTQPDSQQQITVLKYLARAYQQIGQVEQAYAHLDRVINSYRQAGLRLQLGRMLTEKAQAYSSLGQHRDAVAILCSRSIETLACEDDSALQIARSESDFLGQAAALGSLGKAHHLQGEYDLATQYLETSLEIAKQIKQPAYILAAQNSLGNLYSSIAKRDYRYAQFAEQARDKQSLENFRKNVSNYQQKAVTYFQANFKLARQQNNYWGEMRSLLNLLTATYRYPGTDSSKFSHTLKQALVLLETLPNSREKVYALIKMASLVQKSRLEVIAFDFEPATQCLRSESAAQVIELLEQATSIAQQLQDISSESFALGRLGHVYECLGDYEPALKLTQQAQLALIKKDSLYLWQWQEGRIFKAQAREEEAIAAYQRSVDTIKTLRGNLAIASRDFQLDFRDAVEPIYRQLTEIRLERALHSARTSDDIQTELTSAITTIEELRLAELQNYLGNECELPVMETSIAQVNDSTAAFSSMIVDQRIAIILALPTPEGQSRLEVRWLPVNSQEVREVINDLRLKLEKLSNRGHSYKPKAQQVYDWLIRPFEAELEAAQIKTLVFMHDGILRSIPMAILYDREQEQFLIEKYAIANTPSLKLTNPLPLDNKALRVLAFGLTKPSKIPPQTFFPPLENVKAEIESIVTTIPNSNGLLDEDFTRERLQQELQPNNHPILHLATHAKFGIDPRQTFLVTGKLVGSKNQGNATTNNYNEKLTMNQLYRIIRSIGNGKQKLALLTLTACETAAGSDRDALGIAGIALQAGVESAMATLWQVDDQATARIITRFYQGLRQGLSKAEALQATQKSWLEVYSKGRYSHPGYWAPFIIIGNWF
ncbi:MAG: CHAT domain-containing protein [Symploca sp. SIO2E9]|nr:CHAT domain-containing protein [Symploca sp. SIO2E9]